MPLHSLPSAVADVLRVAHAHSVLTLSFGIDATMDRVHRFAHRAHTPDQPYEFFLSVSYNPTPERRPANSITFKYYDKLNLDDADIYCIYKALTPSPEDAKLWGSMWCIIDIVAPDPERIIPSMLFAPFMPNNPTRNESALQQTDMLPIFFIGEGYEIGVPITADANYDTLPDTFTRIPARSTLKVRLNLYNYSPYESQIALKVVSDEKVTTRRLARLVAGRVRCCIELAQKEDANISHVPQPRWRMGTGLGRITVEDIILLGIIFVSPGKMTPLLQVRSSYVF